jgi:hypothetical protein
MMREVKMEVEERWTEKSSLSFCENGAVQQSSDQPENAGYDEINGNDITQQSRDEENQYPRD